MQYLDAISKTTEWSVCFQGKPFNITLIQVYAMTRRWSWMLLWRPIRPSRTNTPKDVLFMIGDLNAKVGSQEIPGVTGRLGLGVQNDIRQRLTVFPRECTGHSKHPLPMHRRWLYAQTSPDSQHQNQTDSILCSQRWRSSIQLAKTRPGADCGSDHQLLTAKFRLKLKKNQIPYIVYSGSDK